MADKTAHGYGNVFILGRGGATDKKHGENPPSFNNAFLHFGLPHGKSSVGLASEPAHIINQTGFANIPTVDS
jgi:hypothetical protein